MMLSRLSFISALAVALAFFGCSSDDEKSSSAAGGSAGASGSGGTSGSGGSGGTSGSSGTGGGGTAGSGGSTDKCAADETNAASTFGCNGAKPNTPPNGLGGACTPDGSDGQGSCSDPNHICDAYDVALAGICVIECTPGATYVSTGGCPTGFRCYDFTTVAYCYPDCKTDAECGTALFCDEDSACSSPMPAGDGGVSDAGDGGVTDASTD